MVLGRQKERQGELMVGWAELPRSPGYAFYDRLQAILVEAGFDRRGGMRRAWLRGRENLHKRYLVHIAGYNLGLIMRLLVGAGTPREFLAGTHRLGVSARSRECQRRRTRHPPRHDRHRNRDARRQLATRAPRLKRDFVNGLLGYLRNRLCEKTWH